MIPLEAVDAVVEILIVDSGWCECRHNPRDKHDVDPSCSTRKQATLNARAALEAAMPYLMAQAWDEGESIGFDEGRGYIGSTPNPYRPTP